MYGFINNSHGQNFNDCKISFPVFNLLQQLLIHFIVVYLIFNYGSY